ncbi:hypothetical protein [Anoxybacillus flavithermus]|uniref:hypothetical protein n=1 Tax=Anoxybacillus flavithermus TaxID=33934 RepID=UPI0007DA11CA|nr:hypothetical protein [Anoxybacillus flavithermus]
MRCVICGQGYVDGAIDGFGDYVCVDCWASGEAEYEGREAVEFVEADVPYYVDYPSESVARFLDACNRKRR